MKNNQYATFYIVRHGETDWNVEKRLQGQTDIPLNATGEAQAKEAAKKFHGIHFDLAFSSDLLRAKRTADIMLLEKGLAVETTKALRERKYGDFEGKPSALFFEYLTKLRQLEKEERLTHKPTENYENEEGFAGRIITFLRETAVANPGKKILIATHAGVFHVLMHHLGFITYEESNNMRINNTAHITLSSDGVEFLLVEKEGLEKRR